MSASAEAAIAEMRVTVDKIDVKLLELQTGVNANLRRLPSALQNAVVDKWNEFVRLMQEAWGYYANIVENLGDPDYLRWDAEMWTRQVGGTVSAKQQVAEAGSLLVDDNWDGSAANQYRQSVIKQKAALEKVRTALAEPATKALNDLASAIETFCWALVAALAALLVGIITAIATVATIIGAVIAGIATAAAFLSAVIGGMIKMESDVKDIKGDLIEAIGDNSGFEDEHWPVLVNTTGRAMQPGG